MDLIVFYLRKLVTVVKNEIIVLPSRVVVVVFFLFLILLPVITSNQYTLRIFTLTCIFAILAASWGFPALNGYQNPASPITTSQQA